MVRLELTLNLKTYSQLSNIRKKSRMQSPGLFIRIFYQEITIQFQLPDQRLRYDHLRELRNEDLH